MHKLNTLIAFLSIILITACGGGGGGASESAPAPTPAPTPEPTPEPTPYTEPSIPDSVEQEENEIDVAGLTVTATEGYTVSVDIDSSYEFHTGIVSGRSIEEFNDAVTATLGSSDGSNYVLTSDFTIGADDVIDIVSNIQLADNVTVSINEGGKLISTNGSTIELRDGNFSCSKGSIRNLKLISEDISGDFEPFFKMNNCSQIGGEIDLFDGVYDLEVINSYFEGLSKIYLDADTDVNIFNNQERNPNNFDISGNIFYRNSTVEVSFTSVYQGVTRELIGNTFYASDGNNYALNLRDIFGNSTLLLKNNAFLNTSVKAFVAQEENTITATENYYGIASGSIDERYDSSATNLEYGDVTVSPVFNYDYEGAGKFQPRLSYENESFVLEVAADYEANQREFNYKIVLDDGTSVVEYPNVALTIINVQD